jgi:hypothetical protein
MAKSPNHSRKNASELSAGTEQTALSGVAEKLRQVRQASRDFLVLWAFEQLMNDQNAVARMSSDAAGAGADELSSALADPYDHNWSILYHGSVLDD